MKISDVFVTGVIIGSSVFLFGFVLFTLQNFDIQILAKCSDPDSDSLSKIEEQQRIRIDDVKNLNESIRRMKNDTEYFIDVMKASRVINSTGGGLPKATGPHDLSGYVSIFHRNQTLQLHCQKCVIVSSSGQMLNSTAGRAIDADGSCIFRMNTAPTLRFENDVGVRTTVRVLAFSALDELLRTQRDILGHPNATKILLALGPHKCIAPGESCERRLKELARNYSNVDFYLLTEEEMFYADHLFEKETGNSRDESGSWLSTGFFTMILARTVCDEIHVYGMVSEDHCRHEDIKKVPYHYYDPNGIEGEECQYYREGEQSKDDAHRFMAEKAIFASWAKLEPKIYFHQPEWE